MLPPFHAIVLGAVEGLTEFLPVSSTGHLILAARALQLRGEAAKTFEVVIQAGALGGVLVLYRARVSQMLRGVSGRSPSGLRLAANLGLSFLPAAGVGLWLHRWIKATLFSVWPVAAALAVGGVVMILVDRWRAGGAPRAARTLETVRPSEALLVGLGQCLSLWPGTSRAMVTIVAGLLLGWPATMAAEYSFLLALPTLGAATLFDAASGGGALLRDIGPLSVGCGLLVAGVVAVLAVRGFVAYLGRRGLAPFGWYRLGVAAVVWAAGMRSP